MRKLLSSAALATVAASLLVAQPARAAVGVTDDPILYWTQLMYGSVGGSPPVQARTAAMVEIAMHDAVSAALAHPDTSYLQGVSASGGDVRAAAAQAAHDVLVALNPTKTADYDAALASSLALVSDPVARAAGQTTGSAYAAAIITTRTGDGSATAGSTPYTPGTNPGEWQPTSPGVTAALPGWGDVTPFQLTSGDQFRAPPPPSLTSAEYAAAYAEVAAIGSAGSMTRTADQSAAAQFWAGAGGTSWLSIAVGLAADEGMSTLEYSRMFATLGTSLADAFIAGFDTKYAYSFWRPVTAIHGGDLDGNPDTAVDAGWTSYITAPSHPSYLSTHSIADATAATVLLAYIDDEAFCATFAGLSRCFDGIQDASLDGAYSRVWGGIHFSFDSEAGLAAGTQLAQYELGVGTFRAVPEPSTWAMLLLGFAAVGLSLRRRKTEFPQLV
jgi:hypothetical protein